MFSVNKVILVANAGTDPHTRDMPDGGAVCTLGLATSVSWKDRNTSEAREVTGWHRILCYRELEEIEATVTQMLGNRGAEESRTDTWAPLMGPRAGAGGGTLGSAHRRG